MPRGGRASPSASRGRRAPSQATRGTGSASTRQPGLRSYSARAPAPSGRPKDARPTREGAGRGRVAARAAPSLRGRDGRPPSAGVLLLLALGGFFAPDLVLRSEVKRRREAIFLDLPEAISVLALALGAGQSLRLALELAARDCPGPLGEELTRALSLARRERSLGERDALVRVARESGEPTFARFAELLSAKESPTWTSPAGGPGACRAEPLPRARRRPRLPRHACAGGPIACRACALVRLRLPAFSPKPSSHEGGDHHVRRAFLPAP